jgi:hypothetical protein
VCGNWVCECSPTLARLNLIEKKTCNHPNLWYINNMKNKGTKNLSAHNRNLKLAAVAKKLSRKVDSMTFRKALERSIESERFNQLAIQKLL